MRSARILREDEAAVSPVIATILMVAITVVLAAVLYVMVSGLLPPIGGGKPIVSFDSSVTPSAGNATIKVASASPASPPSNFKVNLDVGAATGVAVPMPTTNGGFVSVVVGGTTYRVYWTDLGAEGTVNAGDRFDVTGNGTPLPHTTRFTFSLLWSDGSLLKDQTWTTP